MAAAPNYHNRQNNPDFASPYSNKAFSMQRNPRYDDKKDAESENPFYDNRYEHNLNVVRGKPQEPTLDLRNQQFPSLSQIPDVNPTTDRNQRRDDVQNPGYKDFAVQNERKPLERNEAPFFKDYDKKNLQDNNKGDFMRGLGENNRHANIVKEYQQYMRNNPIPAPKVRKSSGIEEMEKNRISLKKRNGQDQQGSDWYGSNVGVGILPGMGGQSENRRGGAAQRQQNMPDYRQPVAGYGYDAPEGLNRGYAEDYRRPMPDPRNEPNLPNKMNHQPSGSRLAGIGSRIIDAERPYYDQMRTPQYTPSKDAIRGNFATPQNPRKSFEGGPGFGGRMKEMQGYSEGANRYERGSYEGPGEGIVNSFEPQVQGNAQRGSNNRRGERDVDGGQEGTSWLEQRQKQEQDKKQQQRDELQRIYREQIEEKKRKKEEEQMRQLMEDKKEEERLRRENEDLQRQFQLEQQKKKDAEQATKAPVKNEVVPDNDYVIQGGRKRPKKQQQAFETSAENAMRPEPMEQMEDYRPRYEEQEEMTLDDMIRQNEKRFDEDVAVRQRYEFSKDPEMEVHREITRQINATLDDQLEKMKRDVEYHAKLLRNELTSYKTQAMVSQELRHNAQKELQRLKEDLRHQRVEEERRPYDNFEFLGDQQGGKGQKRDHERPEEKFSMNLNKKYAKTFTPDEDGPGPNLGISSGGGTLEFETNYVMAAEAGAENKMFREPPKLGELMHRYGVDDDEYAAKHRKDKALKKFDSLFGQKEDGEADSIAALEAQLNSNNAHLIGYGQQGLQNKVSSPVKAKAELPRYNAHNDKEVRDYHREEPNVEGEDEIERIEFLLKQYTDPSLNDKGRGKDVKREEQLDYRVSEKKIFQELEAEGISATHYNMQNQYEDQEEDEEHEYRGEEEGEEGTPRSEVELANVTHEVDMSQNHLKRRR